MRLTPFQTLMKFQLEIRTTEIHGLVYWTRDKLKEQREHVL